MVYVYLPGPMQYNRDSMLGIRIVSFHFQSCAVNVNVSSVPMKFSIR